MIIISFILMEPTLVVSMAGKEWSETAKWSIKETFEVFPVYKHVIERMPHRWQTDCPVSLVDALTHYKTGDNYWLVMYQNLLFFLKYSQEVTLDLSFGSKQNNLFCPYGFKVHHGAIITEHEWWAKRSNAKQLLNRIKPSLTIENDTITISIGGKELEFGLDGEYKGIRISRIADS